MKKITFLLSLFLLIGCKTPEIHIPSFNLDKNKEFLMRGAKAKHLPTQNDSSLEDKQQNIFIDNNKSSEKSGKTPKNVTIDTALKRKSNYFFTKEENSPEKDQKSIFIDDNRSSEKSESTPKIETKGRFLSFLGVKPKVRNEYFTGGKLRSKFVMNDDTGESGLLYKYDYDEKILSTTHIKNGLKNGIETLFNPKGQIIKRTPYVNGRKDGIVEVYYPDGKVLAQITYVNNERHGRASKYNHDGTINEEAQYIHGDIESNLEDTDDIKIPIID